MNTSIDSGFSHSNLHWVRVFYSYKPPWFSIKTSVAGVFKGFCFSGDERWKHLRVELLDIERLEKLSGSRGKGMAVEDGMSTKSMMVGLSVLSRILRSFLMDFSHLFSGHVWMCCFLVFPMLCFFPGYSLLFFMDVHVFLMGFWSRFLPFEVDRGSYFLEFDLFLLFGGEHWTGWNNVRKRLKPQRNKRRLSNGELRHELTNLRPGTKYRTLVGWVNSETCWLMGADRWW